MLRLIFWGHDNLFNGQKERKKKIRKQKGPFRTNRCMCICSHQKRLLLSLIYNYIVIYAEYIGDNNIQSQMRQNLAVTAIQLFVQHRKLKLKKLKKGQDPVLCDLWVTLRCSNTNIFLLYSDFTFQIIFFSSLSI